MEVEQLRAEIASLKGVVQSPTTCVASSTSSYSKPFPTQNCGLCWYHARFAEKANRCMPEALLME